MALKNITKDVEIERFYVRYKDIIFMEKHESLIVYEISDADKKSLEIHLQGTHSGYYMTWNFDPPSFILHKNRLRQIKYLYPVSSQKG